MKSLRVQREDINLVLSGLALFVSVVVAFFTYKQIFDPGKGLKVVVASVDVAAITSCCLELEVNYSIANLEAEPIYISQLSLYETNLHLRNYDTRAAINYTTNQALKGFSIDGRSILERDFITFLPIDPDVVELALRDLQSAGLVEKQINISDQYTRLVNTDGTFSLAVNFLMGSTAADDYSLGVGFGGPEKCKSGNPFRWPADQLPTGNKVLPQLCFQIEVCTFDSECFSQRDVGFSMVEVIEVEWDGVTSFEQGWVPKRYQNGSTNNWER